MATIAELIGANPEQVQDLLDTARAAEEAKKTALLAEEAAKGQQALEASKAVSSEPAEFASRKAQALSKQAKAAMGEVGEKVISDLPPVSGRMGAAMERAARAAAGTIGEGVIEAAGPKHSLITRLTDFADKFGPSALEKLGLSSSSIEALGKAAAPAAKMASKAVLPLGLVAEIASTPSAGADSDVTTGRQLTPSEMANTLPGSPVNYMPPGESSKINPTMASSMYDSPEQIVADLSRPKEQPRMLAAQEEAPSKTLAPAPRTVSAGEPSVQQVQKQAEDKALSDILAAGQKEQSQYADLLSRFKDAQERQRLAQLGISLGQAGERIGSALAMVKPGDQSFYEQQMKLAGGISDQVKEEEAVRQEAEKNDPNSALSKQYQEIVKSMGIAVKGNESAASLMRALPFLQQYQSQKENRAARQQDFKLRMAELDMRREAMRKDKLTSEQNSFLERQAKGFSKDKVHDALFVLKDAERAIRDYLADPSPIKAQSMAYAFAKVNDPNSVVRESELKLFGQAGGLYDRFRSVLSQAKSGLIPADKAKDFADYVSSKIQSAETDLKTKLEPVIEGGKRRGLTPEESIIGVAGPEYYNKLYSQPQALSKSQKPTIKLDNKLTGKAGKTFTDKNGKRYIVNPDETTATEI